jgi:hypothetical protein
MSAPCILTGVCEHTPSRHPQRHSHKDGNLWKKIKLPYLYTIIPIRHVVCSSGHICYCPIGLAHRSSTGLYPLSAPSLPARWPHPRWRWCCRQGRWLCWLLNSSTRVSWAEIAEIRYHAVLSAIHLESSPHGGKHPPFLWPSWPPGKTAPQAMDQAGNRPPLHGCRIRPNPQPHRPDRQECDVATAAHRAHAPGEKTQLTNGDRLRLVLLARCTQFWQQALLIVQPDTLLRWHPDLFRRHWRSKLRKRKLRIAPETIALIRKMAKENRLWGTRASAASC